MRAKSLPKLNWLVWKNLLCSILKVGHYYKGWPRLFFLFIVLMCLSTGKKATFMTQADNNELYMSYLAIFRGNSSIMEDLLLEKPQMIQNTHYCHYVHILEVILLHFCFALSTENNNFNFRHIVFCNCNLFIAKLLLFSFPTAKLQYDKMTSIIWT